MGARAGGLGSAGPTEASQPQLSCRLPNRL